MPPNPTTKKHTQTLNFKYPAYRSINWQGGHEWLDGKQIDDDTEGLWRVYDDLYDLTSFTDHHPGGKMWLKITRGTDITEAFEAHHLTITPEEILKTYFVRKATSPRNSPFTFKEDGFYKTLKRNIAPILKEVPKQSFNASNYIMDALFFSSIISSILASFYWSYTIGFIAGLFLACSTVAAHNYIHRKDNFRMYYFNLSMMQLMEWRITHVLSHHLFPNTIIDYDISYLEPLVEYLPKKKTFIQKYVSSFYIAFLWLVGSLQSYANRYAQFILYGKTRQLYWSDVIPFTLPLAMSLFSEQPFLWTVWMWLFIVCIASLGFQTAGNATHHAPDIFYDGDTPRSRDVIDWGIYQLDTLSERYDLLGSKFLVLTNFGDHALHHLFPTLDHGALNYLYPVFRQTMEEFNVKLRMRSYLDMIRGLFQQLARDEPNPHPPQ